MADASAFDDPFWGIDLLVEWLWLRAGVPNDATAIERYRRQILTETKRHSALGELEISGRRCRLEFSPRHVETISARREPIPIYEFVDGMIWPFLGHYVLTPPAAGATTVEGLAALADLPAATRELLNSAIRAAIPYRWEKAGDILEGWRDLQVRADQVHAVWRDAEPAADQIEEPNKRHVKRGQVDKVANEILEEQKADLVKTNGLLAAAKIIADQMEPVQNSNTIRRYIAKHYWELAEEMGIKPSPSRPKSKE